MDKTTPSLTDADHDWSLQALRLIADAGPRQFVVHGAAWAAPALRDKPTPRGRHGTGVHAHHTPELCLGLEGRPFLDIGNRRYAMSPSRIAPLRPGVAHCEGWSDPREAYTVVWLIFSRASLLVSVVRYAPRRGWESIDSHSVESPAAASLFARLMRGEPSSASHIPAMRADLLAVLADVHRRRATLPESPAPKTGRPELDHVLRMLDDHTAEPLSLAQLASLTRLTPNYLNRLFRQFTGVSIHRYLTRRRMDQAMELCRAGGLSVKEIAARVGYDDPLYFSRAFHRRFGVPPSRVPRSPAAATMQSRRNRHE
jgi:AraC-like DNA-binding protein